MSRDGPETIPSLAVSNEAVAGNPIAACRPFKGLLPECVFVPVSMVTGRIVRVKPVPIMPTQTLNPVLQAMTFQDVKIQLAPAP